jgi:hypothetical protein
MVGQEALSRGYEGLLPKHVFKTLCTAVETYIQINQVNCVTVSRTNLIVVINEVCGIESTPGAKIKDTMFERVMRHTAVNFKATVAVAVEERRIFWTT